LRKLSYRVAMTKAQRSELGRKLGALGCSQGGHQRAINLTPERRKEIAYMGVMAKRIRKVETLPPAVLAEREAKCDERESAEG
jgi:hypothetical protein